MINKYRTMTQSNYKRLMGKFFTETEEQVERLKRPANIYQYNAE